MLDLDALEDLDRALAELHGDLPSEPAQPSPRAAAIAEILAVPAPACPHLARMAQG